MLLDNRIRSLRRGLLVKDWGGVREDSRFETQWGQKKKKKNGKQNTYLRK